VRAFTAGVSSMLSTVPGKRRRQFGCWSVVPGSGAGLLGLQERVDLAGGTLVHGPDSTGDFVVEAHLPW